MRRWLRALVISFIATASAAFLLKAFRGRDTPTAGPDASSDPSRSDPSREDLVEELSDEQKEQMLSELEGHV